MQGGDADGAASSGAQLGLPVPLPLGLRTPMPPPHPSPTHMESLQTRKVTQPQTYWYCMPATILGIGDKT